MKSRKNIVEELISNKKFDFKIERYDPLSPNNRKIDVENQTLVERISKKINDGLRSKINLMVENYLRVIEKKTKQKTEL